jgi:hypothetical protein
VLALRQDRRDVFMTTATLQAINRQKARREADASLTPAAF